MKCFGLPYPFALSAALVAVAIAITLVACSVPAAPKHVKTEFAQALEAGEIASAMVVGDSISAGFGTRGTVEGPLSDVLFTDEDGISYLEPDHLNGAWTNHLRSYLADRGINDFLNASISGRTFTDVDCDFDAWVGDGADAVIVMLGTNDSASLGPIEFEKVATRVLERIADRCSYLVVIAPPKRANDASPTTMGEVETILASVCADHGWEFISTYDALEPGTDDYQRDGLHPTTEGNEKLWASIAFQLGLN